MPVKMKQKVTVKLPRLELMGLESLLQSETEKGRIVTTSQAIKHAVRRYPELHMEVKNLKVEIYDLQTKLKKIGEIQEQINHACIETYFMVHEDQEEAKEEAVENQV